MMKYIYITFITMGLVFAGCSLNEEPPFLSNENVYESASNAVAALDGIYAGVAGYHLHSNTYYFLNGLYSGRMVSRRGGNNVNTIYNTTLSNFQVPSGSLTNNRVWAQIYTAIGRANDAIASATETENPETNDEQVINDVIGQAYFVRAYLYFKLVTLWGEVPLRLEPTTTETINLAVSPRSAIYDQIIADAEKALSLMNGSAGNHYPQSYAANMLLAKVYMALATDDELQGGMNYWQAAYDEASQVYGQYSLVDDYGSLFYEATSDGTSEAIFELQSSNNASHDFARSYSPNNFLPLNSFGRLQVSADFYELHAATYPEDPRITETFISEYYMPQRDRTKRVYPSRSRNNFGNAHPYFFKFAEKDQTASDLFSNKNIIVWRYAELLLMLAEISNELQNGEQLGYVTEVLDRVGVAPAAGYQSSQEEFRDAIMKEYQFELLGEGGDTYHVRRRGYDWFKMNIIDFHNTNPLFDPDVDVRLTEGEELMYLPIPDTEVNINQDI